MPAKILIADASPHAQRMGVRFLSELGYAVEGVSNGPAALKSIEDQPPALIIAALSMPGLSGFELCEQVKRRPAWAQIPILLALGPFEAYDPEEGKKVGAQGFIEKPFESGKLEAVVADFAPRPAAAAVSDPPAVSAPNPAPTAALVPPPVPAPEPAAVSERAATYPSPTLEPVLTDVLADGPVDALADAAWPPAGPADPELAAAGWGETAAPAGFRAPEADFAMAPHAAADAPLSSEAGTAPLPGWSLEEVPLSEADRQRLWESADSRTAEVSAVADPDPADEAAFPAWETTAAADLEPEAAPSDPGLSWGEGAMPDEGATSPTTDEAPTTAADALVLDALRAADPEPAAPLAARDRALTVVVIRKVLASYLSPLMVEEVAAEIERQLPR